VTIKNPLSFITTTVYDQLNRVRATADPLNNRTTLAYDVAGNQVSTTNPLGYISTTVFDLAGRPTASVDQLGNRTTMTYDAASRVTAVINPLGYRITLQADCALQLTNWATVRRILTMLNRAK
jgi:YD repeat-containing protein